MSAKRCIFKIDPPQVTPAFRSLFNPADPASVHCFAVLEGGVKGMVFSDCLEHPSWGAVHEAASGRLYLGGTVHYPCLRRLVHRLRLHGKVLVGMWPNDPRWQYLPRLSDHSDTALDFSDRQPVKTSPAFPRVAESCELQWMDSWSLEKCARKDLYISMFGSAEQVLKNGLGLCLVHRNGEPEPEIVCEAFAAPSSSGRIEIGVYTQAGQRGKGYASLTCAALISEVERQGYRPCGSCTLENHASLALARRLGFRSGQEYRLSQWLKMDS